MIMTFHFSDKIPPLLFYPWEINSWLDLVLAIFIVFLIATFLELIKVLAVKLRQKRQQIPLLSLQESEPTPRPSTINGNHTTEQTPLLSSMRIPSSVSKIRRRRFKFHIVESVLHMFTVGFGYILMLIVMTYNTYLFITVVFSLTAGFLFLGPLRSMTTPPKIPARHQSLTDAEERSLGQSDSRPSVVECAESSQRPYYRGLYD
ncbi:protein SLC31A2-like [Asterias amurensis]|uniref:protein SLC31A2-like n=1 Tax=Asterias amurensis TaxID=7602 RepID=UPI003AB5B527